MTEPTSVRNKEGAIKLAFRKRKEGNKMKKLIAGVLCLILAFVGAAAAAENNAGITGEWVETFDIAKEFEYKKDDVDALTDRIWSFAEDGTVIQYFADSQKVSEIVLTLMTKILTAEISADGAKISDVAKDEGFSSVQAFVESIIKQEKLDTYGSEIEKGTYTVSGEEITCVWPLNNNENATIVYVFSLDNGILTLKNKENIDKDNPDDTVVLKTNR